MFRFVFGVFGALFSAFTIGLVFAAFGVGGVIYMYSRDLPDHETLARYNPATLSRIYSGEGEIMDEFARPGEVRIYVPAEEIPDVVKQAVISAEDRNFFENGGFAPRAIASAKTLLRNLLTHAEAAFVPVDLICGAHSLVGIVR